MFRFLLLKIIAAVTILILFISQVNSDEETNRREQVYSPYKRNQKVQGNNRDEANSYPNNNNGQTGTPLTKGNWKSGRGFRNRIINENPLIQNPSINNNGGVQNGNNNGNLGSQSGNMGYNSGNLGAREVQGQISSGGGVEGVISEANNRKNIKLQKGRRFSYAGKSKIDSMVDELSKSNQPTSILSPADEIGPFSNFQKNKINYNSAASGCNTNPLDSSSSNKMCSETSLNSNTSAYEGAAIAKSSSRGAVSASRAFGVGKATSRAENLSVNGSAKATSFAKLNDAVANSVAHGEGDSEASANSGDGDADSDAVVLGEYNAHMANANLGSNDAVALSGQIFGDSFWMTTMASIQDP